MVVVESATSVKGIMILQNLNLLNVIRLHQLSWLGLELVSTAKLRFESSLMGVKVNSQYYIDKVLRPFIKHDAPCVFPGDQIRDMVFHQDSASSHTSKQTLAYIRKQNLNFVTPQEWMPKSPDAARWILLSGGSLNDACRSEKSTL